MIPIPLWFRPWMLKAGGLFIVISMIFYAGCRTQKNIDVNKIDKLKAEIEDINANYNQCLDMVIRSEEAYKALRQMVEDSNAEVQRLHEEYKLKVVAIQRTSQTAIANIERTHAEAMSDLERENADLKERFALMSAAEACHESWREVVK